mgnify:FL=1
MESRPLIAVTTGDPAGVGPEVVVKALANPQVFATTRPLVLGDCDVLEQAKRWCNLSLDIRPVSRPDAGRYAPGGFDLLDVGAIDAGSLRVGQAQAAAGKAAYEYLRRAIDLALTGEVEAIATAPINKEALRLAGVPYLDHTEILAALTGSHNPLTMFVVRNLRIFFLTRHVSLATACQQITRPRVLDGLIQVNAALRRFGITNARIAVAALNPHGGERGLFAPGIREAREKGIDAYGPIPADSVFHLALQGQFDAVLSLYHDQGHVAAKTLDFERTISITTGLPFVRSSVDHGTAFNIAGQGVASSVSMEEAIRAAGEYARWLRAHSKGRSD